MKFLDWLRAFFGHAPEADPTKYAVVESQERTVNRVAALTGQSPDDVRQEIRRRRLSVEIQSMRRHQ